MHATPVLSILGLLLTILAGTMMVPMMVDVVMGDPNWQAFAGAALVTGFVGVSLWLSNQHKNDRELGLKEAFLLTNGAWMLIGIFGAFFLNVGVEFFTSGAEAVLPPLFQCSNSIIDAIWSA